MQGNEELSGYKILKDVFTKTPFSFNKQHGAVIYL